MGKTGREGRVFRSTGKDEKGRAISHGCGSELGVGGAGIGWGTILTVVQNPWSPEMGWEQKPALVGGIPDEWGK